MTSPLPPWVLKEIAEKHQQGFSGRIELHMRNGEILEVEVAQRKRKPVE